MYIRVDQNEIKFRVSRKEAESIINGQAVSQTCPFSPDFVLTYGVAASIHTSELCFDDINGRLLLKINLPELKSQLATRPTKTGIIFQQDLKLKTLQVSLEIDIKKPKTVPS